jgi:acyl-CoA thioesterase FadM
LAAGVTKHACIDQAGKVSRIPNTLIDVLKSAAR